MPLRSLLLGSFLCLAPLLAAQENHVHPAPEHLGKVSFPVSCEPDVQPQFDRAVALLHSFAYTAAEDAFGHITALDPNCAMAHWGIAMSGFHQLWEPPIPAASAATSAQEIAEAQKIGPASDRERAFIGAAAQVFADEAKVPYAVRLSNYEKAMANVAAANHDDVEAQVFYALALLSNASPTDKTHARQKQAAEILEPLFRDHPEHPGIPHSSSIIPISRSPNFRQH